MDCALRTCNHMLLPKSDIRCCFCYHFNEIFVIYTKYPVVIQC